MDHLHNELEHVKEVVFSAFQQFASLHVKSSKFMANVFSIVTYAYEILELKKTITNKCHNLKYKY